MDLFNTVSQCGFCAYLNYSHATRCELCDELVSAHNLVLLSAMLNATNVRYCPRCDRQLLHNHTSCTYCNAHWSGTSIGSPLQSIFVQVSPGGSMDNIDTNMHEHWNEMLLVSMMPILSDTESTALSSDARERFLQPQTVNDPDALCSICLEALESAGSNVQLPCCQHPFHLQCIQPWFIQHNTCPTCRHNLNERAARERLQ